MALIGYILMPHGAKAFKAEMRVRVHMLICDPPDSTVSWRPDEVGNLHPVVELVSHRAMWEWDRELFSERKQVVIINHPDSIDPSWRELGCLCVSREELRFTRYRSEAERFTCLVAQRYAEDRGALMFNSHEDMYCFAKRTIGAWLGSR